MGKLILTIAVLYGLLILAMVLFQRKLMYHPASGDIVPARYGLSHFTEVTVPSEDGTKLQLWYHEAKEGFPTIIYFHGNAGHLGDRAMQLGAFVDKGMGVVAVSYRGYGKSEGSPSENGIYADARAAIKWLKKRGIPLSDIAFYGESLGTGVAIRMATEFPPRHVFLQAPYTSVVNRAAEIYWYVPVRLLMRDQFDSLLHIRKMKSPLLVFHGKQDQVIPVHHTEKLLEHASEPKQVMIFDNIGHNDFDCALIADHVLAALQ